MAITLTDSAAQKIRGLMGSNTAQGLRIKVVGGGCSGLHYKMNLDIPRDGDKVFEKDGAKIVVDRKSFLYLNGTELDYQEGIAQSQFIIRNPNATRTCGCGESFSV